MCGTIDFVEVSISSLGEEESIDFTSSIDTDKVRVCTPDVTDWEEITAAPGDHDADGAIVIVSSH